MGIKKIIINIILKIANIFVLRCSIKQGQIAFISLESNQLESDLELIYQELKKENKYSLKMVLINYNKKSLINNFLYMLNCIKQIYVINTSKVVLITDNNYVISNFKRPGVKVIQVWHATGAIKKFGNAIKREYPIKNYDYVIANSDYWKQPYQEAFNVSEQGVIITGMPRVDHLVDPYYLTQAKARMYSRYPILKGKKVILYAPTFRGNIYQGFKTVDFDAQAVLNALGEEYVIIFKFHPLLLKTTLSDDSRVINMNHENTHDLFAVCDVLISDFSSIIFDYSLLNKPMCFFVPDLDEYIETLGCFVDYRRVMPGAICYNETQVIAALQGNKKYDIKAFRDMFFKYQDGHNTQRIVMFIDKHQELILGVYLMIFIRQIITDI